MTAVVLGHANRPVIVDPDTQTVTKQYTETDGSVIFQEMQALWSSPFGETHGHMPRPLGFDPGSNTVTMSLVPGAAIGTRGDLGSTFQRLDHVVELITRLHESGVTVLRRRDAAHLVRSLGRKAATMSPDFGRVVELLASTTIDEPNLVVSHGDFSPRNLIDAPTGLVLIDFDRLQMSSPACRHRLPRCLVLDHRLHRSRQRRLVDRGPCCRTLPITGSERCSTNKPFPPGRCIASHRGRLVGPRRQTRHPAPRDQRGVPTSESSVLMTQRVLFHARNRRGLGHLSRTHHLARSIRRCRPDAAVFIHCSQPPTDSQQLNQAIYSDDETGTWAERMVSLQPNLVVYDTVLPDGPETELPDDARVAFVLRARERLEDLEGHPMLNRIERIIVPHEPGVARIPPQLADRAVEVGVLSRRPDRERAALIRSSLRANDLLVVSTPGGGGFERQARRFFDITIDVHRAIRCFIPESFICACSGRTSMTSAPSHD